MYTGVHGLSQLSVTVVVCLPRPGLQNLYSLVDRPPQLGNHAACISSSAYRKDWTTDLHIPQTNTPGMTGSGHPTTAYTTLMYAGPRTCGEVCSPSALLRSVCYGWASKVISLEDHTSRHTSVQATTQHV